MTPALQVEALDLTRAAIAPYDRPDLDARLLQAKARLTDGRVRVLVVGEFKQGKSFLVDCLVGALVCPVHDDIATSVPTLVRNAEVPSVALVRSSDPAADPRWRRDEYPDVPVEHLASYVARAAAPGEQYSHVEVGIPRSILEGGLEIVDTPGVGGFNSVHGAATMAALPSADAVLLVSDASQEYTAPELEFARQAIRVCPNVACVLTKTDLYPEWRRIAELDQEHLKAAGIERRDVPRLLGRALAQPAQRPRRARLRVRLPDPASATCASASSGRPTSSPGAPRSTTCWRSPTSSSAASVPRRAPRRARRRSRS